MTAIWISQNVLKNLWFYLLVGTLGLAVVTLATERPSFAAAEDADALIQRGLELRKKGEDDAALALFRRAYGLAKTPRGAAQLGFSEQSLGEWAEAQGHVQEALAASGDPWIVKNRATIEGALQVIQEHTARADLRGGVDGGEVEVNGRIVGKLPMSESIWVSAGAVDITLRAPGYRPGLRSLTVAPHSRTKVHFSLEALAAPTVATATVPTADGGMGAAAGTGNPPDRARRLRITGIGLGAVGAALVGVGVACMITGNHKLDDLKADAEAGRPYNEGNENWKTFQTTSVVLFVAGGAALVGGAVAFYLGRVDATNDRGVARSLYLAPTGRGAVLVGAF